MNGLALKSVDKSFGGVVAAEAVTMDVPNGKVTGVIGPNGAGKTTLVNLITGMLTLSAGSIELNDEDIAHVPASEIGDRGIARTFQNIRLLTDETVVENIMIGFYRLERSSTWGDLLGLPSSRAQSRSTRERALAMLRDFRMERYANHLAGSLSYGHQRKVEMMRAFASEPQVMLLDEPVAGMNAVESEEMGVVFRNLADSGVAVLIIEHNMRFISSVSDHLYVLDRGRIIAEGSPKEVLNHPAVISAYLGD